MEGVHTSFQVCVDASHLSRPDTKLLRNNGFRVNESATELSGTFEGVRATLRSERAGYKDTPREQVVVSADGLSSPEGERKWVRLFGSVDGQPDMPIRESLTRSWKIAREVS